MSRNTAAPPPVPQARSTRSMWVWILPLAGIVALGVAFFLIGSGPSTPAQPGEAKELPPLPPLKSVPPSLAETSGPAPAADREIVKPTPQPAGQAPEGMVWIPGGTYNMGDPNSVDQDSPWHRVGIDGFWMDKHEVTNAEFEKFVKATGYVTVAERVPTKEMFPDADPKNLVAGSAVFKPVKLGRPATGSPPVWWEYVKGASWRS